MKRKRHLLLLALWLGIGGVSCARRTAGPKSFIMEQQRAGGGYALWVEGKFSGERLDISYRERWRDPLRKMDGELTGTTTLQDSDARAWAEAMQQTAARKPADGEKPGASSTDSRSLALTVTTVDPSGRRQTFDHPANAQRWMDLARAMLDSPRLAKNQKLVYKKPVYTKPLTPGPSRSPAARR